MKAKSLLLPLWLACAPAIAATPASPADLVAQMTPAERQSLLHGIMALPIFPHFSLPADGIIGSGYVPGIPRLGIPALRETDAGLGVAYVSGFRHDGATALPSGLAMASGWDTKIAYRSGAMIGAEAAHKGFNVMLAGSVNLARDPRAGRNFEYLGEDPLLAGTLDGAIIAGIQSNHIISTLKHFAVNDLETGRNYHNAVIGEAAARESDLLAFELALEGGDPGSVMCAYNHVNGPWACDSADLLTTTLKQDWHFKGFVMSDWGAVHAPDDLLAGLDQESGEQIDVLQDGNVWFDAPLTALAASSPAYRARITDAATRIVATMTDKGLIAHPPVIASIDYAADARVAQREEEAGIVLLQNQRNLLPLATHYHRIAIIGGHADLGVLSGGGSSQVAPPGGPVVRDFYSAGAIAALPRVAFYLPSSPRDAIARRAPGAEVSFDDGLYPSSAAAAAARADVAIVFATKWGAEGEDEPDLSLPSGQDGLIAAVAAANPNTIVVLETPGPVLMPWRRQVAGIVEAWYPGAAGGEAIARVLFGEVPPAGRLPISFPAALSQLPRPVLPGQGLPTGTEFDVNYTEGSDVGYRWYARTGGQPLFPFGFGLSTTRFAYSDFKLTDGSRLSASITVTNVGSSTGIDTPQFYLLHEPGRDQQRLVGWGRVTLAPGQSQKVSISVDPRLLSDWDTARHDWHQRGGVFVLAAGANAADLPLHAQATLLDAAYAP